MPIKAIDFQPGIFQILICNTLEHLGYLSHMNTIFYGIVGIIVIYFAAIYYLAICKLASSY